MVHFFLLKSDLDMFKQHSPHIRDKKRKKSLHWNTAPEKFKRREGREREREREGGGGGGGGLRKLREGQQKGG